MSGARAAPIPDNGCSSTDEQLLHASANGDQTRDDDVHSHIVELSESIDHDIRNNTWKKNSSKKKTIFRVPKERLHAADKITYQPVFLSIGPYHSGVNATEEMRRNEQGKLCILNKYHIPPGGGQPVVEYMKAVESMEAEARICYEGDVKMDRSAFCRMLLLDAFQLIALLDVFGSPRQEIAPAAAAAAAAGGATATTAASSQGGSGIKSRNLSMTVHDFLMLENQIPFFVVEKIYELRYYGNTNSAAAENNNGNNAAATNNNGNATRRPISELAWNTINAIIGGVPPAAPNHDYCLEYSFQHLVHVCHVYLKPTCRNVSTETLHQKQTDNKYGRFRRATEYYDAGVKFRRWCREEAAAAGSQPRPMLDVTFANGVLSIALQKIDEKTGYILRNVLAYEQKYWTAESATTSYVTAYVVFMSQLLGSAEDVALLSRRGVMEHLLGTDDEVCALFRGLAAGLFFDPDSEHYLKQVGMALKGHCSYSPYRWRAWIIRHRFGNPWLVAAWVFGASAVICTIVQTVFTVLSYVNPGQPHA